MNKNKLPIFSHNCTFYFREKYCN